MCVYIYIYIHIYIYVPPDDELRKQVGLTQWVNPMMG